ncbi:MAG: hypothetical protein Q7T59_02295, partial [Candidatus Woesebacteria bacterium]|nr:hypothetical protein [Candidatus Woesebacteria bacterium]
FPAMGCLPAERKRVEDTTRLGPGELDNFFPERLEFVEFAFRYVKVRNKAATGVGVRHFGLLGFVAKSMPGMRRLAR